MICAEVVSNKSFKHNKERSYFEREEQTLKRQRLDAPTNAVIIRVQQAKLASYLVARRIARTKKAHNIVEELVKPSALDVVLTINGNVLAKKLGNAPLSNRQFINGFRSCRVT